MTAKAVDVVLHYHLEQGLPERRLTCEDIFAKECSRREGGEARASVLGSKARQGACEYLLL
jgi:hypothetical protein